MCATRRTNLQTYIGVFHTLLGQAGDREGLAVVFKIYFPCCSGVGSAVTGNEWIKNEKPDKVIFPLLF